MDDKIKREKLNIIKGGLQGLNPETLVSVRAGDLRIVCDAADAGLPRQTATVSPVQPDEKK